MMHGANTNTKLCLHNFLHLYTSIYYCIRYKVNHSKVASVSQAVQ